MILGSTPEFRDLCFFHAFDTTVIDYNPTTFQILGKSLRHPCTARLVAEDWRVIDLRDQFDLVIGDLAVNMVSVPEQETVVRNVRNALRKGGQFIHRAWVRDGVRYSPHSTTLQEIVGEYLMKRPQANPFYSLALPLIRYYLDDNAESIDFQRLLQGLRDGFAQGIVSRECLTAFEGPWHRYLMPNWLPTEEKLRVMMGEYFTLADVEHGDDPYSEFCPIFVLQK